MKFVCSIRQFGFNQFQRVLTHKAPVILKICYKIIKDGGGEQEEEEEKEEVKEKEQSLPLSEPWLLPEKEINYDIEYTKKAQIRKIIGIKWLEIYFKI